ncbi:uncharacterized protein MYCGRDRAFT_91950 [Zymoseptoria tritici IPO323]|uniref:Uncharacterized protein n=1 Tax=Zymoseptoria tritici (strain CBS 115943 / IPO323) TaxID=336722 RepID=F9X7Z7_ZYMTI|nr:uncharacterized protein MYCGRDRAFT_91950 [Zymoseptoria tritici IPO323]EGP89267.1 hypothetical protein MYCGRDRAFT_91950 [Zymoseptoria tritici IPO323]
MAGQGGVHLSANSHDCSDFVRMTSCSGPGQQRLSSSCSPQRRIQDKQPSVANGQRGCFARLDVWASSAAKHHLKAEPFILQGQTEPRIIAGTPRIEAESHPMGR